MSDSRIPTAEASAKTIIDLVVSRRSNTRVSHHTLVLVEHLKNRDKAVAALKKELANRGIQERVWAFDAKPKNTDN